jgi:hypothetical protein
MPGIKQKILRIVLAISLMLAPMAPAVATMSMNHSSAHTVNANSVDHGAMQHSADVPQGAEHCAGTSEEPGKDHCQLSCCGHCSLSMTFVVPQSALVHCINSTPPFVNALQASFTVFTHFRPPA